MRFIHTSDWHLGKNLDGYSRLEEQEKFCEDFINIVNTNDIDMVIIAGDIYDRLNPSVQAEKLFYKTVSRLANNGERCVLIISGNNDNPERLEIASNLLENQGVIIIRDSLNSTITSKGHKFKILESKKGCIKLDIDGERTTIIALGYLGEKKVDEYTCNSIDELESEKTYSQKIKEIFKNLEENFDDNTINIALAHLFVIGGESSDSERPIQIGESLVVDKKDLPSKAQYIALGHLHKSQKVSERINAYYSGSPLQYSKDERDDIKGAYIVDIKVGKKPNIEKINFNIYKSIEVFKCNGVEEALNICEENKNRDIWSYFEIKTEEFIKQSDIKKMKNILKGIIEIRPIITSGYNQESINIKEKSKGELFKEFYTANIGSEPKGELMDLFLDIISEEGDTKNETN